MSAAPRSSAPAVGPFAKSPSMVTSVTSEALRPEVATVHGVIDKLCADVCRGAAPDCRQRGGILSPDEAWLLGAGSAFRRACGSSSEDIEWTCPNVVPWNFRTDFQPKHGPGFFPGAGGYFHGCFPEGPRRIVFFGTDFGPQSYWEEEVTEGGGEKRTQVTLCNLRCLVEAAGVDPCSYHLTNTVLALAKGDRMTGNDHIYGRRRYWDYLKRCGEFHQEWISPAQSDPGGAHGHAQHRRLPPFRLPPPPHSPNARRCLGRLTGSLDMRIPRR